MAYEKQATNLTFNVTEEFPPEWRKTVKLIFDIGIISLQITVMVTMGCIVRYQEILGHLRRPLPVFVAMICQFGILPLLSFSMLAITKVTSEVALGVMILSCSPGGNGSNLFTLLCKGDVPLSIVMTTLSTALSSGMMPLNLWIYTRYWDFTRVIIPYKIIVITLAWILIPLLIGMIILAYASKTAALLSKIGRIVSFYIIWQNLILQFILTPEYFISTWHSWLMVLSLQIAGYSAGYGLAFLARRSHQQCRTIALETGMQSVSLSILVIIFAFESSYHDTMIPFSMMYGLLLNITGFGIAGLVWFREKNNSGQVNISTMEKINKATSNGVYQIS